ncbi:hypothetical protein Tco_1009271 [Tanacetum coccineum]
MKCPQYYLTEMQEINLFYNWLDIPTRHILDSRGAIPSKTAANAKIAIQEMVAYSQKWNKEHLEPEVGDIEQQLQDSIKGTMQILHAKNEGNQWKIP